jgi:transaldolase
MTLVTTKIANPLLELQNYGQSVWHDNISRDLLDSGALQRLIEEDGLRGLTSNPTIFEKAINGSTHYDASLKLLLEQGKDVKEIYEALAIEDIQRAADLFRPIFNETNGQDGFVSLEVSPKLAHQTAETLQEARRLWRAVNRPNVMIKVPGTPAGIPAIEQLIGEGININITMVFSIKNYTQVAEAYIRGQQSLEQARKPLTVASVASFFVSRVDTSVDKLL